MTTLLGIITDLHADLGALRAALDRLDALGVDRVVCAGDIVDGGDQPEEVIALLRKREIPCIRGTTIGGRSCATTAGSPSTMATCASCP